MVDKQLVVSTIDGGKKGMTKNKRGIKNLMAFAKIFDGDTYIQVSIADWLIPVDLALRVETTNQIIST